MKKLYNLTVLLLFSFTLSAQNQWVWVQGTDAQNDYAPVFGVTGVEDEVNWPVGRKSYNGVTDTNGKFWMFGGIQEESSAPTISELWNYNPSNNNFTFKRGSLYYGASGYSKGIGIEHYRNTPQYRSMTQMWIDNSDNIYVFSGMTGNVLNDFWKYNPVTNNWMQLDAGTDNLDGNFGTKGLVSPSNHPPALKGATTWKDTNGNLWMFGGTPTNTDTDDPWIFYDALWKYNLATGNWVWVSGTGQYNSLGNYAVQGQESTINQPPSRAYAAGWVDNNGNLCLFGGNGPSTVGSNGSVLGAIRHNDIWKFNTTTNLWTWVKGNATTSEANISTTGTEHQNNMPPGNSAPAGSWKDLNGNFWVYGTKGNQLWKYNPITSNWSFMNGQTTADSTDPVYGTFGVADAANTPGSRTDFVGWTDTNGDLCLFSGADRFLYRDDVWKYTIATNSWTWIKGCGPNLISGDCAQVVKLTSIEDEEISPVTDGTYDAKWQDSQGNLWLYSMSYSRNDHLWKFNSATKKWKWIKGEFTEYYQPMIYPEMGVEAEINNPSVREKAFTWTDVQDNLWLFGGADSGNLKNDLWKFTPAANSWTWVSGSSQPRHNGTYGTQGVVGAGNIPGSRNGGVTWVDNQGNLWLFGGQGLAGGSNITGGLNDLWKYDIALNQWTWMKGAATINGAEVTNGIGLAAANNTPRGQDTHLIGWKGSDNMLWLLTNGNVWKYNIAENVWIKSKAGAGTAINYGTYGVAAATNSPGNARKNQAVWTDTNGDLIMYGGVSSNFGDTNRNDLWRYSVTSNNWIWTGGTKTADAAPNYGIMGQANYSNMPGTRVGAVTWQDNQGNKYLYGGTGFDAGGFDNSLSDVWVLNGKFNIISGTLKFDATNNSCSATNTAASGIKVIMQEGNTTDFTFTDANGNYIFYTEAPTVTVTPQSDYFTASPASQAFNFTGYQNTVNRDFCLTAAAIVNDLEVTIVPVTQARPGFDTQYKIVYTNRGNTTLSGTLQFTYPDNVTDFVSAVPPPTQQSASMLQWNYTNLTPFASGQVLVTLNTNGPTETPAVNGGDVLPFEAVINPVTQDEDGSNNTFSLSQEVINAFDPNDKTCLQGTSITLNEVGDYVTYLIRFENMGTASAVNVIVTDTIDTAKFDVTTIKPVDASHPYRLLVTNGLAQFMFEGINLPFGANNNGRHGYVSFKIKTRTTLTTGDIFNNGANIYFDYNYPVDTNIFETQVTDEELGTGTGLETSVIFYPNPVKNVLTIQDRSLYEKAVVYDMYGRVVLSTLVIENRIDTSLLSAGAYVVKISNASIRRTLKIIKN